MLSVLRIFLKREEGAVTVDWVVLTAALVGLGTVVIVNIAGGALDHSSGLGAHLDGKGVTTSYGG